MMVVVGGCAKTVAKSASNAKFEKLMYFEKYRNIRAEEDISIPTDRMMHAADYGTVLPVFEWSSHISEFFEEAKSDIRSFFGSADFFNWEKFENAQLTQMKEEMLTFEGRAGGVDAAYIPNDNVVMVFQCVGSYSSEEAKAVIAHELIHVLTETQETANNPAVYEGLTEMLSSRLYGTTPQGYGMSCNFASMYIAALGVEEATKNIMDGKVFEDVNSKTKPGAMEDVTKSILALDMGYAVEEDYLLYVDFMVNYAIAVGTIDDIASQIKNIRWSDPSASDYFIWLIEEGGDNNTAA